MASGTIKNELSNVNAFFSSTFSGETAIGTGIGCGFIHNLPKGLYLINSQINFTRNANQGTRRSLYFGDTSLSQANILMDTLDGAWLPMWNTVIAYIDSTKDIYFTLTSTDSSDTFNGAYFSAIKLRDSI